MAVVTETSTDQIVEKEPAMQHGAALPKDYQRTLDEIRALEKLPEGWDSYGANRISKEARDRAAALIATLGTHEERPAPIPTIGPSPGGGVILRWMTPRYDVMVNFLSRSDGECSVVDRASDEVIVELVPGRAESLLRDIIIPFVLRSAL